MKNYTKKILRIVPKSWIKKTFFIVVLTLFHAAFELMGIGLVIPFLSIFLDQTDFIFEYFPQIKNLNKETLILICIFLFLIIFVSKNLFSIIYQQIKVNFSHNLAKELSGNLYQKYLDKNYIFFTLKNSAGLIRNITSESHIFVTGVVVTILNLISDIILFLAIITFLFYFDPIATLTSLIVMILFGILIVFFQLKKMKLFGTIRQASLKNLFKLVNESIGNIKEIILSSNQKIFKKNFDHLAGEYAEAGKKKDLYFILVRPILEILTVLMFLILVYVLIDSGNNYTEIFIVLGVFSFASIKLIAIVGNLVREAQSLRYNSVVVDVMYDELFSKDSHDKQKLEIENTQNKISLKFDKLNLTNISYSYPLSSANIFENINFEINQGDKLGFIGESGSGKTTLVNLITGLIEPKEGIIKINNKNLIENLNEFQNIIGYVSQNVYLADETFKFNIGLNKIGEKIDVDRINHLIKILDLENLINNKKDGINSTVGEKGIQISGGQMQRIGIARAMYDNPEILILDEATNALDVSTQIKVLKNISNEMKNKTVISISHDKNTLKHCDKIFLISKNEIKKID
ncbi:ABC transporter ATP-binding protein/permease [Candidatus Pelagibacter sp.]|nr:ABC transporter ATP-binding protein/permease [Candidatus Pelagibacter sp.]